MTSYGRRTLRINPITAVGVVAILFCVFSNVNSYSKYGRGCRDIGCLPSEVCVMSHDSCDFGERDGKDCGSYPTCQKNGNSVPSGNGGVKPSEGSTSHSSTPVQNSNVPSGGGSGGFDGFSAGGHGLYPSLPNNPSPQYPSGGYQPPYNPYGGYNPGMGGGNNGGYNGGAGGSYGGSGGYYGGGGQQGGGGYNNRGGYQPAPQPSSGKKEEGNGFFTNLLNQAASQYLNGQIQRVLNGGGQQPQPSGGYGNGGSSGGSGGGSGFLNSFLGSVLNGGGGGNSQPPRSSQGGSGGLGFLGDLLNSRGSGGSGGGSAISEILGSRNFGGLFNEKSPSGSSNPAPSSYGAKSYPTQGPTSY